MFVCILFLSLPLYLASSKQMGPPPLNEPRFCSRFLPVYSKKKVLLAPVSIVLTPEGFRHWALERVFRQLYCVDALSIQLNGIELLSDADEGHMTIYGLAA